MTIIKSAYDTRVTKAYITNKLEMGLAAAQLSQYTNPHFGGKVHTLDVDSVNTSMIDHFTLPFLMTRDRVNTVFLDMRTNTTYDKNQQTFRIRNTTEYEAKMILGKLASEWADGLHEQLLINIPVAMAVFASMIGEAVGKRVGAAALVQLQISIMAAIHYMNCFVTEEEQESSDYKARLISMITRHCGYRADEVTLAVKEYYNINGLETLCDSIKEHAQSVRLDDLNPATLLGWVGAYWYSGKGHNGPENLGVALEYPPMWLYILYMSFSDRSYRNTRLFDITDRNTYRKSGYDFVAKMLARTDESI